MFKHEEILVFDFETTGLSATNDQILEIGAAKYKKVNGDFQLVDELSLILNTDNPISEKITEITGITPQMQEKHGVSQNEGFNRLDSLINKDTLLIAYNIQFDLGFLLNFYYNNYDKNFKLENDILDIMAIYKDRHKFPHRLESGVSKYQINFPNTHRALDDVKATYALLLAMKEEKNNIEKYVNVIGFNKKYGVSGPKLDKVRYVKQYGGFGEIDKL